MDTAPQESAGKKNISPTSKAVKLSDFASIRLINRIDKALRVISLPTGRLGN